MRKRPRPTGLPAWKRARPWLEQLEDRCVPAVSITEFPVPTAAGSPSGITVGADGNLWFTEFSADRIGRITPAGVVTEFVLPSGQGPLDIVSGPDGLLYFTENLGDRIGSINPRAGSNAAIQASLIEFIVPGLGSAPNGITVGSDGAIWFTQSGSDEIGRLTTAGVVTEFTIPTAVGILGVPAGITAGPDGALWFTLSGSDQIGRIPVTAIPINPMISLFTVPGATNSPTNITAGPDGALWFTNLGSDEIGRITTGGVVTEFPLTVGTAPFDITTGPGGLLFFTEAGVDRIGSITTSGVVQEFGVGITAASAPTGITLGPDNALWFTENLGDRIGRLAFDFADTFAVGLGAGGTSQVNVYNSDGTLRLSFLAYGTYAGGVRVSTGDVDGDGTLDVITGAGPGAPGGHVKAFNATTGATIRSFFAFDGYTGGVFVASGDVNNDGFDDIIVGADAGAPGGHVKVFDGRSGALVQSFFAFDGYTGGVTVGAGDVNNDDLADVIVGAAGMSAGGHVKVFAGLNGALLQSFFSFAGFNGSITVAGGDIDGDGFSDVIVGAGPGASGGHVKVFDGQTGGLLQSFFSFSGYGGGVTVGATDGDSDDQADIVVGAGPGAPGGHVKVFDGLSLALLDSFFAFPGLTNGVFVGGVGL